MSGGGLAHFRRSLGRGLLLVLPLIVTVWLLTLLFSVVDRTVTPVVFALLAWLDVPGMERTLFRGAVPLIGLLLTVGLVYALGLLAGNLLGRRFVRLIESFILRVPLVKGIYGSARQLLDALSSGGTRAFRYVVLIEYPRPGLWTVGFVTTEVEHRLGAPGGVETIVAILVFLPTTPNPTSGWMVLVPTDSVQILDMTVEDGIKLVVSGGIVGPDDLGRLLRPWPAAPPA